MNEFSEKLLTEAELAQAEREFDVELENSVTWERFGALLTEAHASVYRPPVDFGQVTKKTVTERYGFRNWGRVGILTSGIVTLVMMFLGVMTWNSETGTVSEIVNFSETETELETVSTWEDTEDSEYDWEAGELELAACDEFLEQLAYEDRTLDWEIAILDTSLSDLAAETVGTAETDEENWF